ncbi:MAG: NADH-quinone oxidoreductase subunit N [Rhodobacterales bacterium 12-64-8]|nr:MAG: NADH-quinone oxidoreductase subunit N [Rhodobacterales bacterium 12-64-8]OYX47928.1 MAG: NADH-quinone oxidoreductase subunit N [Alphaproteobacteria bacterium 32-64-14]
MDFLADINNAAPEAILAGFGLVGLLIGAIGGDRISGLLRLLSVVALAAAAVVAAIQFGRGEAISAFASEPLAPDGLYKVSLFTLFAKVVTYALAAFALLMSGGFLKTAQMERYEYPLLIVFGSLGAGMMLSANDLMTLYVGIETLSLSSYVLAAFRRDSIKSAEAGLKYFVLGALASGLLLYGSSLVYGFTGGTGYAAIAAAPSSIGLTFGLVFLICGLAFKASAAPFHIWTPDVYEGAPAPVVAFFSTAPKIAAVGVLAHVLFTAFGPHAGSWQQILAIIAALSMLIGAFGALMQNSIKRILAYSSISNVGFALIGVAAGAEQGAAALLVYMALYVVATLGLFGGVLALRRGGRAIDQVSDLNGLVKSKPGIALGLMVLIFSVAGIPPAAGFWGKLQVFTAGISADLLWLVLVGALASVVSLGYYLRLVWAMFMKPAGEPLDKTDMSVGLVVAITSLAMFPVLTIVIQILLDLAMRAAGG